jgi:hypothetical protein
MRSAGIVLDNMRTFATPLVRTLSPANSLQFNQSSNWLGFPFFYSCLRGDVLLVTWKLQRALQEGIELDNMWSWLAERTGAQMQEEAKTWATFIELKEGDVAWIPFGEVATIVVTETSDKHAAFQIPLVSAKALDNEDKTLVREILEWNMERATHGVATLKDTPQKTRMRQFLEWAPTVMPACESEDDLFAPTADDADFNAGVLEGQVRAIQDGGGTEAENIQEAALDKQKAELDIQKAELAIQVAALDKQKAELDKEKAAVDTLKEEEDNNNEGNKANEGSNEAKKDEEINEEKGGEKQEEEVPQEEDIVEDEEKKLAEIAENELAEENVTEAAAAAIRAAAGLVDVTPQLAAADTVVDNVATAGDSGDARQAWMDNTLVQQAMESSHSA